MPHQTQAARLRVILICILLGANAPMRSDYRNIVIASRIDPIPEKTPYYNDGWIYTPPGSRLKDSDGLKDSVEKIDVTAAQDLIETLICYHESELLFGIPYDSSTFSRLLRDQTKRTKGVECPLGIRFFRTKYSAEDTKVDAAYTVLAIMGHNSRTHRAAYSGSSPVLELAKSNDQFIGDVVDLEEEIEKPKSKRQKTEAVGVVGYGPTTPCYTTGADKERVPEVDWTSIALAAPIVEGYDSE